MTSYRGGVGGYHSSSLCSLSSASRMMMLLDRLFLKLDLITLDSALSRLVQVGVRLSVSLTVSPVWAPSLSSGLRINMSVVYLGHWSCLTSSLSHLTGKVQLKYSKCVVCGWVSLRLRSGRHPPSVSKVPLTSLYSNPRLLLDQLLVSRSDLSLLH